MRFQRRLTPQYKADLVPMIDVVLQLVIFFMVSSTFIQTPGIPLVLPESKSSEGVAMTRLVVTVISEEEIYLNKERTEWSRLGEAVAGWETEGEDAPLSVIIEGDRSVSYDLLVRVLDVLRQEGFRGVSLRVRSGNPGEL